MTASGLQLDRRSLENRRFAVNNQERSRSRETSEHVKTSGNDCKPSTKSPIPRARALGAKQHGGNSIRSVYGREFHYSASCGSTSSTAQGNFDQRKAMFELFESRPCCECVSESKSLPPSSINLSNSFEFSQWRKAEQLT